TVLSESGVIDQHIHLKVRACGLIQYIRGRSGFGQVGRENQRARAVRLLECGSELTEFVRAAGDENQVVTFAREDAGEFHSDAERGAGDQSGLAVSNWHLARSNLACGAPGVPARPRKCRTGETPVAPPPSYKQR